MYYLLFEEIGQDPKCFYFHDLQNAENMKKELLLIEINNILRDECGQDPFDVFDDSMNNYDLHRVLDVLIKLNYRDEYDDKKISITVSNITFEDEPIKTTLLLPDY
jgi:hypothetical protein